MHLFERMPFWGWFVVSILFAYLVYNPGMSWFSFIQGDHSYPAKLLLSALVGGISFFYVHTTWKTLGPIGLGFVGAVFGALLWLIHDEFLSTGLLVSSAGWWVQIPVGIVLTLGLQGGKIYRVLTGNIITSHGQTADVTNHHDNVDVNVHHN